MEIRDQIRRIILVRKSAFGGGGVVRGDDQGSKYREKAKEQKTFLNRSTCVSSFLIVWGANSIFIYFLSNLTIYGLVSYF